MFVVTGLHTKRRSIGADKPSAAATKHPVEKTRVLQLAPSRHRKPLFVSSSSAHRLSVPGMTRNDDTRNRNDRDIRLPTKFPLGRPGSTRGRKFIPKPLILVERMKARQLLESSITLESLNRSMITATTPLSILVTPPAQRKLTCSILSSDSQPFSSISFRISSHKGVISETRIRMMRRSTRPFSSIGLDDSSSTLDTFVADSPCRIKQGSNGPALLTEVDRTRVHMNIEFDAEKKYGPDTGISAPVDSVVRDLNSMHQTSCSIDTFEPTMTSTPFAAGQENTANASSPTTGPISSTPTRKPNIVSPTSQTDPCFNAPKGAYIVKLPNTVPTIPHSNTMLTNAPDPKSSSDLTRALSRARSPSPTLVLDGVFALPHAPPSLSSLPLSRHTPHCFPRPRKPARPRRPTPLVLPSSDTPMLIVPQPERCSLPPLSFEPESPRSKLARVLNTSVELQMRQRKWQGRGQGQEQEHVSPLVKAVRASSEAKTQRERVLGGGGDENDKGGSSDKGVVERVSFGGGGMVAKLRARWERGEGVPSR